MSGFLGEIVCKVDSKGRLAIPSTFMKQMPTANVDRLVINRGWDQCLSVFTESEWNKETAKFTHLNTFEKKKRRFLRQYFRGANYVPLDASGRILISKTLLGYADIKKEVVVIGMPNCLEIWAKNIYDTEMEMDVEEFSSLAEEVMGDLEVIAATTENVSPAVVTETNKSIEES